jgi:hypothetical protein
MRRLFITWLAICGVLFGAWQANAQFFNPPLFMPKPSGTNNLTADGFAKSTCDTTTAAQTVTLSTTLTNDEIIVGVSFNVGAGVSISDTAGLTWNTIAGSNAKAAIYQAKATSVLTSDVITYTNNSIPGVGAVYALAIHGANLVSPFDPHAGLPVFAASGNVSVPTTNQFTVPFAVYSMNSTGSPTAGAGFTGQAASGCFSIMEYQIVSTAQSGLAMALTTGALDQNAGNGDAVTQ